MRGWLKFIAALGITMLLMLMFRALFFTIYIVPNNSLEPLFIRGDRILVNKWSYGLRTGEDIRFGYSRWIKQNIRKGDIAAFNYPIDTLGKVSSNPVYVSCCVALPGDTVNIGGKLSVVVPGKDVVIDVNRQNAVLLCNMLRMHEHRVCYVCNDELYVKGRKTKRLQFDKDYYWMSNLNTAAFDDSRYFGFVPEDHIIGRVVMLVYSKDDTRPFYKSLRRGRFFKIL